jgi:hypothetical protein
VRELAAGALRNLSTRDGNKTRLRPPGPRGIPPLVALLSSPSIKLQESAADTLRILNENDANKIMIASAGWRCSGSRECGFDLCRKYILYLYLYFEALLLSPSVEVQAAASRALGNLGVSHE